LGEFQSGINFENLIPESIFKRYKEYDITNSARWREYLAGRTTAMLALKSLGSHSYFVGRGSYGEPIWPSGIVGSISHNNRYAVCCVGYKKDVLGVGLDVEDVIDSLTMKNIKSLILTGNESKLIENMREPINLLFTLLFSAKESFFKFAYPFVHKVFGFETVEVTSINFMKKLLTLKLTSTLTNNLILGDEFYAHFDIIRNTVLTMVISSPLCKANQVNLIDK